MRKRVRDGSQRRAVSLSISPSLIAFIGEMVENQHARALPTQPGSLSKVALPPGNRFRQSDWPGRKSTLITFLEPPRLRDKRLSPSLRCTLFIDFGQSPVFSNAAQGLSHPPVVAHQGVNRSRSSGHALPGSCAGR
jgi:hypothetical protein